jgi:hypothetical protein
MQHHTPLKVPTALYRRHGSTHFLDRLHTLNPLPHSAIVRAGQPRCVVGSQVHGTPKDARPFEVRGVEVRVANYDGGEAAFAVYEVDGGCVDECDKVPQDVPLGRLEQDGALPDTELFRGGSGARETGWEFGR